ncbi:Protein DEHYDRATION-INDUCED 19-like 5, partial [Mucuna pruriens]
MGLQHLLKPQATSPLLVKVDSVLFNFEEADIMDFDFRSSFHSVKHLSAVQAARLHSVIHCTDVDNDDRCDFRCPFCDFEIEVPMLCSNLEEEHCSALKMVVCPVCEENLGKDAIMQFTHSSSRKWALKPEKSSIWSGNSAMLGKKLASRGNKQELIPDPLLSPFICNLPIPNPNNFHPDENSSNNDIDIHDAKRSGTDAQDMGDEQDKQERRLRASFVQQLLFSTILEE